MGSMQIWIEEVHRRPDGSIVEVKVDMDGFKALMSPEDVIAMNAENPGRVVNIAELINFEDEEEEPSDGSAITVTETEEGCLVDLVVPLATTRTSVEAKAVVDTYGGFIDAEVSIVKNGNALAIGGMSRDLRRMGLELGDRVRVIVLRA